MNTVATASTTVSELEAAGPLRWSVAAPADWAALGRRLHELQFRHDPVMRILEVASTQHRVHVPLTLRRLDLTQPLHQLVRLFVLQRPLPRATIASLLAPIPVEMLLASGLLLPTTTDPQADPNGLPGADQLAVSLQLLPQPDDLLVVHDNCMESNQDNLPADHVVGVGWSTLLVASLIPARPYWRGLELGCGQGYLATRISPDADFSLEASGAEVDYNPSVNTDLASTAAFAATAPTVDPVLGRCQEVVATDVNLRALNLAHFNALLNGRRPPDFRLGSLYEPVAGDQFDLIVCNPPFVISPATAFVFRDNGLSGDSFSQHIIAGLVDHLTPGGMAVVICNWHHDEPADWPDRPLSWLALADCDVVLLKCKTTEPLDYIFEWNRDLHRGLPEKFAAVIGTWLDYYQQEQIKLISGGLIVIRKRPNLDPNTKLPIEPNIKIGAGVRLGGSIRLGSDTTTGTPAEVAEAASSANSETPVSAGALERPKWVRCVELPDWPEPVSAGEQIYRLFQAEDRLQRMSVETWLQWRPLVAPGVELNHRQHFQQDKHQWQSVGFRWVIQAGIHLASPSNPLEVLLVSLCDGQRTMRELVVLLGQQTGIPLATLGPNVQKMTTQLLRAGILTCQEWECYAS